MLGPSGGVGGPRPGPKRAPATKRAAGSLSAGTDRLWRTAYEHRASELRIVVNGFLVGTHTVGRALTRQSVAVTLDEPIGFVEVFGEHDVRLAFLDVQPVPEGPVDQSVSADLSEERRLQVRVSFARPFPEVHVEYEDPHWQPADVIAEDSEVAPREARRAWWPARGVSSGRPRRPLRWALRWRFALAVLCLALYALLAPTGTAAWAAEQVGRAVTAVTRELMALPQRLWGRPPLASRSLAPITGLSIPPASHGAVSALLTPNGTATAMAATATLDPQRQARVAIEALARLDTVGALLGGQIDVTVAPRAVVVHGLVDDERRKREMLRALGSLQRDRMVQIDLVTVAERVRQQAAASANRTSATSGSSGSSEHQRSSATSATSAPRVLYRPIEFTAGGIPVGAELRAHLTRYPEWTHAEASVVEAEVRRIATAGLRRSRAALLHAVLLQSLAERYDASALQALDAQAYETWRSLLATHAAAFADEMGGVRELLRPAFLTDDGGGAEPKLNQTTARIDALAIEIDEAIRAGLSAGPERAGRLRIKDAAFWQTVRAAERLARTLGR